MKLGYYNPQLKVKQIIKGGKVVGDMILTHRAYGYNVQLHYHGTAGYTIDKYFPTEEKARLFFDRTASEISER